MSNYIKPVQDVAITNETGVIKCNLYEESKLATVRGSIHFQSDQNNTSLVYNNT